MIVPMSKVYIVTQSHNNSRLLDSLALLGVVHIEPIDPDKAVVEEKILHTLSIFDHAIQILQRVEPSGDTPDSRITFLAVFTAPSHHSPGSCSAPPSGSM